MESHIFGRKKKSVTTNADLFTFESKLSSKFVHSGIYANYKTSDEETLSINLNKVDEHKMSLEDDSKQRLKNLEEHLGSENTNLNILSRLKILEEKIIRIEEFYPQVALRVFKYESEIPKGSGRLSKAPDLYTDFSAGTSTDFQSKKIEEMKSRLNELRSNIGN